MSAMADVPEFGSRACTCPKCGKTVPHSKRGIPCSEQKCPKCGAWMTGEQCKEESR